MRSKIIKPVTLGIVLSFILSFSIFAIAENGYVLFNDRIMDVEYSELTRDAQKQVDCLAENIYHEARAEPENGRIAVALVTLNRVNNERFPKDICSVVKQKTRNGDRIVCQFSWFCMTVKLNRNSEYYKEAVRNALHVYANYDLIEDFTKGSLYYHADYVSPGWKLHKTVKIGRHIFYKEGGNNYAPKTESSTERRIF
jgi:N-acetylmuramoyl-L-alanine amidase